jgi:hypothetical protein
MAPTSKDESQTQSWMMIAARNNFSAGIFGRVDFSASVRRFRTLRRTAIAKTRNKSVDPHNSQIGTKIGHRPIWAK